MVDIGSTFYSDSSGSSHPITPGNGESSFYTPGISVVGNSIRPQLLSSDIKNTNLFPGSYYNYGVSILPVPISSYYSLTAKKTSNGVREYWVDSSVSLSNSPSGSGAYISGTLTILGTF